MNRGNLSRRGFLAQSVAGLTAAGLPIWAANELMVDAQETTKAAKTGPNGRISMGAIGTGTSRSTRPNMPVRGERGIAIMQNAMRENDVWPIREGNNVAGNGILFEGEDNKWIWVSRSSLQASDRALLNEEFPAGATRLPRATNHMANFLSCVRSRQQPICHAGVGHRSVSVCHLGVIATRFFSGQTLRWDPAEERFTGDNAMAANSHLSRAMRAPWRLQA